MLLLQAISATTKLNEVEVSVWVLTPCVLSATEVFSSLVLHLNNALVSYPSYSWLVLQLCLPALTNVLSAFREHHTV